MNSTDHIRFVETMTALGEIYKDEVTPMRLEIYWKILQPYPYDKFREAAINITKRWRANRLPSPAEFEVELNPPEDVEAMAEMAVNELMDLIATGGWESFEFQDPILAMAVNHLGGFHEVLRKFPRFADQEREQIFWIKDFKNIYKIYARRPIEKIRMRVKGSLAIDNEAKGFITDDRGNPIPLLEQAKDAEGSPVLDGEGKPVMRQPIGTDGMYLFLRFDNEEGKKYLAERERKQIAGPQVAQIEEKAAADERT